MVIPKDKKEVIDTVEPIVVSYFGLDCQFDIYCRQRNQKLANARFCLWHYLHYSKGFTLLEIARQYDRARRNVCFGVAKIKCRIEKVPFYKDMYDGFIQCLNDNGIS